MHHRIQATINRKALAHNLAIARAHARGGKIVAVIKANAYGHGLLPVAEALHEADIFGVTDLEEAERLRAGSIAKEILILQGPMARHEVARAAQQGFQLLLHGAHQLAWLEEELATIRIEKPLTLWLKLESGMNRLGLSPIEFDIAYTALKTKPWVHNIVLTTHLANSSMPEAALNSEQLNNFHACKNSLGHSENEDSIAASASLLALDKPATPTTSDALVQQVFNQSVSTWARPGIMLYGSSPFLWQDTKRRRETFGLQAVMTLQARLISIRDVPAGASIGYNSQFICPSPMRVGIVSIGYADGYPSNTPNGAPVMIQGKRTQTIGRVSMDMLAIDLTSIESAQTGDVVTLWGDDISLDEVAAHTGILSYNLTCSISSRVPFVYK
ncbi:MAG: alanine racemase [Pseudomonadota bacterium]